jgi:hypothetical protein
MTFTVYNIYVNLFKTFSHVNEEAVLFFELLTHVITIWFTHVAAYQEAI